MPKVMIDAEVLSVLVALSDQESDRLHDLVNDTADDPDPIERQAHLDYSARAEEALQAVLVARRVLSEVSLLKEARDMLEGLGYTMFQRDLVWDARRVSLVGAITSLLCEDPPSPGEP